MKKFDMDLSKDLHMRLKHWCVDPDTKMGEVIRCLINILLSGEEKKPKK